MPWETSEDNLYIQGDVLEKLMRGNDHLSDFIKQVHNDFLEVAGQTFKLSNFFCRFLFVLKFHTDAPDHFSFRLAKRLPTNGAPTSVLKVKDVAAKIFYGHELATNATHIYSRDLLTNAQYEHGADGPALCFFADMVPKILRQVLPSAKVLAAELSMDDDSRQMDESWNDGVVIVPISDQDRLSRIGHLRNQMAQQKSQHLAACVTEEMTDVEMVATGHFSSHASIEAIRRFDGRGNATAKAGWEAGGDHDANARARANTIMPSGERACVEGGLGTSADGSSLASRKSMASSGHHGGGARPGAGRRGLTDSYDPKHHVFIQCPGRYDEQTKSRTPCLREATMLTQRYFPTMSSGIYIANKYKVDGVTERKNGDHFCNKCKARNQRILTIPTA